MILTDKRAWSEGLHQFSKIVWVLNSSEFVQRNIKLITKLKSLGLSIYLIGTYIISVDSSKLKEIAISLRVSAYIK